MSKFGFGHVEIGTVTPLPQSGNPKPRMFRIPKTNSLLNSIGFKSDGVKVVAKRLEKRKNFDVVIGGNIGKNKLTDNLKAANDYYICFKYLEDLVDYFTINISSPNTPGLRNLSDKELNSILEIVTNENNKRFVSKPIFLKLSPDIDTIELQRLVNLSEEHGIEGLVLTNTTTNHQFRIGGMSGAVLNDSSHRILKEARSMTSKLKLISCGGIMDENTARERFDSGADLIQLYTGLVYNGPRLIKDILK
jgi:dihydroorotate dehydrogenase